MTNFGIGFADDNQTSIRSLIRRGLIALRGEPFKFRLPPEHATGFLAQTGWTVTTTTVIPTTLTVTSETASSQHVASTATRSPSWLPLLRLSGTFGSDVPHGPLMMRRLVGAAALFQRRSCSSKIDASWVEVGVGSRHSVGRWPRPRPPPTRRTTASVSPSWRGNPYLGGRASTRARSRVTSARSAATSAAKALTSVSFANASYNDYNLHPQPRSPMVPRCDSRR